VEALLTERSAGFLADDALIERILEHLDRGTTDLSDATWREPVSNYRSADRLTREIEVVLRRQPVPFCPSASLGASGSYVARVAGGTPIFAVRGDDGVVRAFRNSCRHRGTALVHGQGCARSLVCPFHGWVYRLDGALRHVPDQYGFPGLDVASNGLVPVATIEAHGVVFVDQSAGEIDAAALAGLPEVLSSELQLLGTNEDVIDVNWKVFLEGFLEGYHIKATHRQTFFPFGYDNLNVVEHCGRHSRVTFPFRRIEALRGVPPTERRLDGAVTTVQHIFPNVIVARLSHHTSMVVLEPITVDQTALVTYRLANQQAEQGAAKAAKDSDFVRVGLKEDREMALAVQRGLASGANDVLQFGRFEGAIVHFHRQLTELLGEDDCRRGL
jgi:phenylpropionate dioxygenase-like ring-hydroxylating dioxygenase large terminal subunit